MLGDAPIIPQTNFHVYSLPSPLPYSVGVTPYPTGAGLLSGVGPPCITMQQVPHILFGEWVVHPVSLLVPLPSILSHLSWAGGDGLVGCLLYWLLTTRLEAVCYLNWTYSSRESQMQGSAVGEWRADSWGRGMGQHTCVIRPHAMEWMRHV